MHLPTLCFESRPVPFHSWTLWNIDILVPLVCLRGTLFDMVYASKGHHRALPCKHPAWAFGGGCSGYKRTQALRRLRKTTTMFISIIFIPATEIPRTAYVHLSSHTPRCMLAWNKKWSFLLAICTLPGVASFRVSILALLIPWFLFLQFVASTLSILGMKRWFGFAFQSPPRYPFGFLVLLCLAHWCGLQLALKSIFCGYALRP